MQVLLTGVSKIRDCDYTLAAATPGISSTEVGFALLGLRQLAHEGTILSLKEGADGWSLRNEGMDTQ